MSKPAADTRPPPGRWRLLCALAAALLVQGCAAWNDWQRQTIYRPTALASPADWQALVAGQRGASDLTVPVNGGAELVKVLQLPARPGRVAPVRVLYLHGTYRHAGQNLGKAAPMLAAGLDVFLPDYRGWGASSLRVPSEASIHEDAWTVWQDLQALQARGEAGAPPVRWVIYGHSMGSAVAVQLAQRLRGTRAYCALVLESAFTSLPDVAAAGAGWGGRLLSLMGPERMASIDRIALVDPPVWFLHGSRDETVPPALGRRLYDAAPAPKQWREWPLGHSNLQTDPDGGYAQTWRDIASTCADS